MTSDTYVHPLDKILGTDERTSAEPGTPTRGESVEDVPRSFSADEIRQMAERGRRKTDANVAVNERGLVYFIKSECPAGFIKIGLTLNVAERLYNLQRASPYPLVVLATREGGRAAEREFHERFAADRERGEWFRPSPALLDVIEALRIPGRTQT